MPSARRRFCFFTVSARANSGLTEFDSPATRRLSPEKTSALHSSALSALWTSVQKFAHVLRKDKVRPHQQQRTWIVGDDYPSINMAEARQGSHLAVIRPESHPGIGYSTFESNTQVVIGLPHLSISQPHFSHVAPPQSLSRRDLALRTLGMGAWQRGQSKC